MVPRLKKFTGSFTTLPDEVVNDPNLNTAAKAIYWKFFSLPEDWKINLDHIRNTFFGIGKHAFNTGLKQLLDTGYVQRVVTHDELGMYTGYDYHLHGEKQEPRDDHWRGRQRIKNNSTGSQKTGLPNNSATLLINNKNQKNAAHSTDSSTHYEQHSAESTIPTNTDTDSLAESDSGIDINLIDSNKIHIESIEERETREQSVINKYTNAYYNQDIYNKLTVDEKQEYTASIEILIKAEEKGIIKEPEKVKDLFNVKEPEKIEEVDHPIIQYWNECENLTTHGKKTTKLYKKLFNTLAEIKEGTFAPDLDKNKLADYGLKNLFTQPMNDKDLYKYITWHDMQFEKEYEPEDTSMLARSFDSFIYNPRTRMSQLLLIANKGIRKKGYTDPAVIYKQLPAFVQDDVKKYMSYRFSKASDKRKTEIYTEILSMYKNLKRISKVMGAVYESSAVSSYVRPIRTFWSVYWDWVTNQDYSTYTFTSSNLKKFLVYAENMWHISLDISEENLKKIRRRQEKRKPAMVVESFEEDVFEIFGDLERNRKHA